MLPRASFAAGPEPLTARLAEAQIAPAPYGKTAIYGYDGLLPGPVIRVGQGERVTRAFVNDLPVASSIHWHGIRIDNAMDGVAGLTQEPVPPGESFLYDFVTPDAGTFWYHAHTNSAEQVERGLYGPLIVDEAQPPDVDRDEILMLDDWRIDTTTLQLDEEFAHPMEQSHGGRMGNLIGTNGRYGLRIAAGRSERLRLRLINAANARIFVLKLLGMEGWTVALDGMPLAAPEPVGSFIALAPAQRVDLIVDVTGEESSEIALLRLDDDDQWRIQVGVDLTGAERPRRPSAPEPLPPNPNMGVVDLDQATPLEMRMQGGAMAMLPPARFEGEELDAQGLMAKGMFWTLAGVAGLDEMPFARLARGEEVRLTIRNDTAFPHAMHLHGMHFREVKDGQQGPMRDTILSLPGQPIEIAFIAGNPGKWLFHCHMLDHAASGMTTWIEVAG